MSARHRALRVFAGHARRAPSCCSSACPAASCRNEDQGYVFVVDGPAACRLAVAHGEVIGQGRPRIRSRIRRSTNVVTFAGFDLLSRRAEDQCRHRLRHAEGLVASATTRRQRRPQSGAGLHGGLNAGFRDGVVIGFNPPPIQGVEHDRRLRILPPGPVRRRVAPSCADAANKVVAGRRQAAGAATASPRRFTTDVPQYRIDVDREKAKALGMPINTIFDTMQSSFGSLYVNDFTCSAAPTASACQSEAAVPREAGGPAPRLCARRTTAIWCRSSALVTSTRSSVPTLVDRFNIFPAAKIHGQSRRRAIRSGQAIAAMQEVVVADAARRLHDRLDRLGIPGAATGRLGRSALRASA